MWIGPVQFAVGYFAGRLGGTRWWSALVACVGAYLIPVFIEGARERTSHNLIPFELALWTFVCGPVALGALLGRLQARRRSEHVASAENPTTTRR